MQPVIIAKGRVIGIEEVSAKNPYPSSVVATTQPPVTVSKIRLEPYTPNPAIAAIAGILSIPMELPYGKTFHLVLVEPENPADVTGRQFNE